jgi:hypothetical protein
MLFRVVWQKLTDVSEVLSASIVLILRYIPLLRLGTVFVEILFESEN